MHKGYEKKKEGRAANGSASALLHQPLAGCLRIDRIKEPSNLTSVLYFDINMPHTPPCARSRLVHNMHKAKQEGFSPVKVYSQLST